MFGIVDHDKSIRTSVSKGAPIAVYPLTPWTNGVTPTKLVAPAGATFVRIYAVGGGGGGYYGGQGGGGGGTGIWEGPCSPGEVFNLASNPSAGFGGYDEGGDSTAGGDAICSRNGTELCAGLGGKGTASSGGGKGGGWRGMYGVNGGDGGAAGKPGGSAGLTPGGISTGGHGGGGASLIGLTVSQTDWSGFAARPQFGAGSSATHGAPGGYLFIFY